MELLVRITYILVALLVENRRMPRSFEEPSDAKLKHLDYTQAAIARMSGYSFLFKGWAITLITGLAALAAIDRRRAVLIIGLAAAVLFWALDGYYLWLERGFVARYNEIAATPNDRINFSMVVNKKKATRSWVATCFSKRLLFFYGVIILIVIVQILLMKTEGN